MGGIDFRWGENKGIKIWWGGFFQVRGGGWGRGGGDKYTFLFLYCRQRAYEMLKQNPVKFKHSSHELRS